MDVRKAIDQSGEFDRALSHASVVPQRYVLRLYVTGSTARSTRAIQNIREVCDRYLDGRYELEVIDIHQQPALASREQIVAAPTLIKLLPAPLRKMVGDLSDMDRVLAGLNLRIKESEGF